MIRAKKLGLKGWVWNHPDHSVEGVAVGSTDQISKLYVFVISPIHLLDLITRRVCQERLLTC